MHIPDGYLSPSTCASLYAFSAAGWYSALRRTKRSFGTRTIPLISVFAAFSFVVMMFNIPLPGGTTGHALGVTVAAIVLGPWASALAISLALAIQALLFGDGGITTLGANCFNMAIIGSFVAYGVYRLIASGAQISSKRRITAAAVAGYVSINVCALLTAIEFGIQPALFHDASGAPLYAPYPLRVAIPAMMIGHLTFAGLAEAVISAGMVSYLLRSDSRLISTPTPSTGGPASDTVQNRSGWNRPLWWAIGILLLCTPLGILAAGTAWGEWSASDLANGGTRAQISAASGNHEPPALVPQGLQKMASLWTAPFPGYAPGFIKSPFLGYLLSGMFTVGLFVMASLIAISVGRKWRRREASS
jgi:cobalt/nickel transport system permease protein